MPPKILMNLCIALIMLSVVFLAGVERGGKSEPSCQAVAFLLQYSFLAVFSWSAIEGFHSTRGLVFPMKTDVRHFITKAMPIGWGKFYSFLKENNRKRKAKKEKKVVVANYLLFSINIFSIIINPYFKSYLV